MKGSGMRGFGGVASALCACIVSVAAAADWSGAKIGKPQSIAVNVNLPGAGNVRVEVRPFKARLADKLPLAVTPEGLSLDLPAVFAAGAQSVRVFSPALDAAALSDRDVRFTAELIGAPGKKFARAEVIATGKTKTGNFSLRQPKNKHFPSMADPVIGGRDTYDMAAVVPCDATELRGIVEFTEPGEGATVFCGFTAKPNAEIAEPPPAAPKVLFHAPFDGTADATVAGGCAKPMVANGLTFVAGRFGQAVRLDPAAASRLVYAAQGNVNPERGTMTCWYRHELPVAKPHGLFAFSAGKHGRVGDGHLQLLWKPYRDLGLVEWERGDCLKSSRRWGPMSNPLPTNGWVQLTLTWNARTVTVYANGDTVPPGRSGDAENPLGDALIGPRPFRFAHGWQEAIQLLHVGCGLRQNTSWSGEIDDLRVWSEPFTRREVAAFYRESAGPDAVTGDEHGKLPWRNPQEPPPPNRALRPPEGAPGEPAGMELVEEVFPVQLAKAGDAGRFRAAGDWSVGACEGLEYLEAGKGLNDRFAIRFRLDGTVPLWCFEVTYPDDKARAIDLVVQGVKGDGGYSLNHGVETGLEHPLTMKNATKRYLFWRARVYDDPAENGDLAFIAMTQTPDNPAAISRIRVYAIRDGRIPAAGIVPAPAVNGLRRHSAIWFEDPAIMGDFGVQGGRGKVDDPLLLIDRISAYMKYTGQDMLIYPAVWYNGIIGANYMPREHMPHFMRETCRRFERDDHVFVPSINQQRLPQLGLKITRRQLADGTLCNSPISILDTGLPNWGGWHHSPTYFNISHPDVQNALLDEIRSVCRECRDHASFGGVAIDSFNAVNITWWGSIAAGYNDYSIDGFEKATGIRVPVDRTHPLRGREYAKWLKAHAYDQWVQYRCDVLTDFYRRCAETVRAARPDLMLYVRCSVIWRTNLDRREDLFRDDFIARIQRESGLDCAALAKLPGVALANCSMPAYWHDELHNIRAPRATLERIRDLPETEGFQKVTLGSCYPMADFHDSYYETAVGASVKKNSYRHGDGRLSGDWLVEKSWRVTHFSASGREALRPYAKALKYGDVFAFGRGGFSLGTCGDEAVTAPFMKAFRALPAVKFADVPGFAHPDVRFRTARAVGSAWHYLVNTGAASAEVDVTLPPGAKDAVSGAAAPARIALAPYELRAFTAPQ